MVAENKQKATLHNLDTGDTVTFQFNPSEYTFKRRNQFKETAGHGLETPALEFSGGRPATLKMKLFFDTTDTGEDVRQKYTGKLLNMMKIKPSAEGSSPELPGQNQRPKGSPTYCRFQWGKTWSFTAVVSSVTLKYTMFLADGTPVRATGDVTFTQATDGKTYPFQNPTSRSEPRRTRLVQPGDRLDLIAFDEYGDASRWYELAQANELEDPLDLKSGQILKIPMG